MIDDDSDYLSEFDEQSDVETDEELEPELEEELDPELEETLMSNLFSIEEEEPEVEDISESERMERKYAAGIISFKEALMRKYADGQIDSQQYFTELLELEMFENTKIKTVAVTPEGIEIIKQIRTERLENKEKLLKELITQNEHDELYYKSLQDEKYAVNYYKASVFEEKKVKVDLSGMNISDKLDYLIKKEDQIVSKLAKKHSISLKKPNSRLKNSENPDIRDRYNEELSIYEENKAYIMDKYLPGYNVKRLNPTGYTSDKYEINIPITIELRESLKIEEKKSLVSERDVLEQEKQKYLQNQLRSVPREILIKCLKDNNLLSKSSSYIQRLRSNKVPILKFIKFPKDQDELNEVIDKDLVSKYTVSRELIDSGYYTKIPTDNSIEATEIVTVPGKPLALKVPFKGISRSYVGKVIETVLQKNIQGEDLSSLGDKFDPILPIPDPLYMKMASAGDLEDKVAYVYQLYTPIPGFDKEGVYVITRYTDFDDYLKNLKSILSANLIKLENEGSDSYSIAILQTKINKISYYLENKEDPDILKLSDTREEARIELVTAEIEETRTLGKSKINNFILSVNHDAIQKADSLENRIYVSSISNIPDTGEVITTFNKSTYEYLILKVMFVLTQYPDMLQDFINGELVSDDIIDFETPLVNTDDFTKEFEFKSLSPEDKLSRLLEWKPENSLYLKYKKYLDKINSSKKTGFKTELLMNEFNKNSIDLEFIEIEKIIQEEYEVNYWEEAKKEVLSITKIPNSYTPELWKFIKLNKKRYTLPSLRIYRVASVKERVEIKERINRLFLKCKLQDSMTVAYIVENMIYTKSTGVKDYKKYSNMIFSNYKEFCLYLNELSKEQINIINYIPIITEFFYKNGEELIINKEKVMKLLDAFKNDKNIEDVLKELSKKELELYRSTLLHIIPPDVKRRFKLLSTVSKLLSIYNKSYQKIYTDKSMLYVKPHVQNSRPETGDYIFYNDEYIVGGKYPRFKDERYDTKNYSTEDLQELANIFGLTYTEFFLPVTEYAIEQNDFDNYMKIMNRISDLTKSPTEDIAYEKPKRELEFKTYAEPRISVQYTLRPRMGVPNPGQAYYTSKDYIKEHKKLYPTNRDYYERQYAVPYKFENFIPVYHKNLKDLADKKIIILEGPAIFKTKEEDPLATDTTSPYYIFIEYKDSYGKIVYFKEGVSEKKVITTKKDSLDTCKRFKNKEDCNNPNSYSVDSRKCFWDSKTCVSSFFPDKIVTSKDIWEYVPEQEELKIPWSQAIVSAKDYISSVALKENLGEIGVAKLISEQSARLYEYRLEIEKKYKSRPKPILDKKPDTSLLELVKSAEIQKKPEFTRKVPKNFKMITIRQVETKMKSRILTSREIRRFKTFELPDLGNVNIISVIEKDLVVIVNSKELGQNTRVPFSQFVVSDTIPTISVKSLFVYISNEDNDYLNNPPSVFSWKLKKLDYDIEQFMSNEVEYKTEEVNYIDTTQIVPSGEFNSTPLVKREDIDKAMVKLAFSEYLLVDDRLQLENKINATDAAIKLALTENISLYSDNFKLIIREITSEDVLKVIESKRPNIKTLEEKMNEDLNDAIKKSDKKEIEAILKNFTKMKIEPKNKKLAESKILDIEERVRSKEIEKDIPAPPKLKEDPKKLVKSFRLRSVISSRADL